MRQSTMSGSWRTSEGGAGGVAKRGQLASSGDPDCRRSFIFSPSPGSRRYILPLPNNQVYSEDVDDAALRENHLGNIQETEHRADWGSFIRSFAFLTRIRRKRQTTACVIGGRSGRICPRSRCHRNLFGRSGHVDPWSETVRRKPSGYEDDRIARAKAFVQQLRLIPTPRGCQRTSKRQLNSPGKSGSPWAMWPRQSTHPAERL